MRRENIFIGASQPVRVFICGLPALLLIGVGLSSVAVAKSDQASVFVALALFVVVLTVPLILFVRKLGVFHPLIFTILWVGLFEWLLRRVPIYAAGLGSHSAMPSASLEQLNAVVAETLLLTSLGFTSLYAGYFICVVPKVPQLKFVPKYRILPRVIVVAGISSIAFLVLANEAGGIERLLLQRGIAKELRVSATVGGHWTLLISLYKTACLVWLALRPWEWKRPVFMILFASSLVMWFFATGSRGGVIMPVIFAAVIWTLHYGRIPYGRGVFICIAALVALGVLGEFRAQSSDVRSISEMELDASVVGGAGDGLETLFGYAGASSGVYGIIGRVPNEVGFLYGLSYLSIPAAPIPSALWPDKPDAGGRLTGWYIFERGEWGAGAPPGPIGEAYWNFHLPGVIAIMFAYGGFLKWLARFYRVNRNSGWAIVVYVYTLFTFNFDSSSFYTWLHSIVPVAALLLFFCGLPYKRYKLGEG